LRWYRFDNIDIVERFQLTAFLGIVAVRNCMEILGGDAFTDIWNYFNSIFSNVLNIGNGVLLQGVFTFFQSNEYNLAKIILGPPIVVMATEILVDWLKHSFIIKFNGISPSCYQLFRESLSRDLLGKKIVDGKLVDAEPDQVNIL
jgi:hypothetical protein